VQNLTFSCLLNLLYPVNASTISMGIEFMFTSFSCITKPASLRRVLGPPISRLSRQATLQFSHLPTGDNQYILKWLIRLVSPRRSYLCSYPYIYLCFRSCPVCNPEPLSLSLSLFNMSLKSEKANSDDVVLSSAVDSQSGESGDSLRHADDVRLAELGYRSEFKREFSVRGLCPVPCSL
jgi:hypothetical protein